MSSLRDLSIRYKLVLAVAGLIVSLSAFIAVYFPQRQHQAIKEGLEQRARVIAATLAFSSAAALEFDDKDDAASAIAKVRVEKALVYASIRKPDGSTFAEFKQDEALKLPENLSATTGTFEENGILHVVSRIGTGAQQGIVAIGLSMEEIERAHHTNLFTTLVVALSIVFVGVLFAYAFAAWLSKPLSQMTDLSQRIADGSFDVSVGEASSKDELGQMRDAFGRMIKNLKAVADQANAVAGGDYSTRIDVKSDRDLLSAAINKMTVNLREAAQVNKRDSWLKTGRAELSNTMRGEQMPADLSRNIVTFMAKYLGAQVGALYMTDRDRTLHLVGSYAYTHRRHLSTTFKEGEGLVGQSALEKQPIILTDAPKDYIQVTSGLGEAPPSNMAVVPAVLEGDVKGVLELGTFKPFDETQLSFLLSAGESIAVALNSAQDRERMRELLQETQRQSEELKSQREELQVTNEELEEQARVMRESEEKLRMQSEELQTANEELEEKTQHLQTQKKEIEEKNLEIERRAREVEQASKYKSEFLSNMSHELRTPLNSLLILSKSFADNEEGNLTPDQIEAANIIYTGGHDLLTLINDILDLSKVEAGKLEVHFEEVRIETMIQNLQRQFEPVAKQKGIELLLQVDPSAPVALESDMQRLQQIIRNLLSNAIKFTGKGSVSLRIFVPPPTTRLQRNGLRDLEPLAFAVKDTGIGIPKEKQGLIFEAFRQADGSTARKYGGTGLGLTISRELSNLLGGEIQVESEEGKGATFTLYLPRLRSSARAAREAELEAKDAKTEATQEPVHAGEGPALADDRSSVEAGDKTLLIIEDDLNFARTLMQMARRRGYKCLVATEGRQGLQLAKELRPSAIVLDIMLPDIPGQTILEQLKFDLATRHIPVHIVSGTDEDPNFARQGAIGFAQKPVSGKEVETVFRRFERLLQSGMREVLLVDDDRGNRQAIASLIKNDSVNVTFASTGSEALELITNRRFDCVILDLTLPEMDGIEVMRELKRRAVDTPPVIVHSGRSLSREEHKELSEYAQSIVIKGESSSERLIDEASLFLHSVESTLAPSQRKAIQLLHDPDQALRNRKILLVDDDQRNNFALSAALKKRELNVQVAENGQLALDALAKDPSFDMILMDIMMPVMDGFEAIRRIRTEKQLRSVPIVALTAKAMREDREKCMEAGANDYLTKPIEIDKLLSIMRVWLFEQRR